MDLADVYRIFPPISAQYTFFPADMKLFPNLIITKVTNQASVNIGK
jgi:hypothetical protein